MTVPSSSCNRPSTQSRTVPSPNSSKLQRELIRRVLHYCYEFQDNNQDFLRFGGELSLIGRMKNRVKGMLARRRYASRHFKLNKAANELAASLLILGEYEDILTELLDARSRNLVLDLLCFRMLGSSHVKLPLNTPQFWFTYRSISRYEEQRRTAQVWTWALNLYEMPTQNGTVRLNVHPLNILNTFLLEQYAYSKGEEPCRARPGDVVIDAGGCYGDTALYFADLVGIDGRVFTFEFIPENLTILRRNLDLNKQLQNQVTVVERAVWSESEKTLAVTAQGPGSTVDDTFSPEQRQHVRTLTIDDLVSRELLEKVDFIKMDIEGAELNALRGAEATLRRFRPQLAISVYHRADDFASILSYLHGLDLGYRFAIDHFTIHHEETVLFAMRGQEGAG